MTKQGWDLATHQCGRCGTRWDSTTEAEHLARLQIHGCLHDAADVLRRLVPDLSEQAALDAAAQLVGSIVGSTPSAAQLRPAYAFDSSSPVR